MATKRINWYPGASCHITARGNHRNDIFRDEEDFEYYLTLMEEALDYYKYEGFEIVCYCLI